MIAIPQCLDFADARLTKDICEFYLRMLEIKNREIYLHSQQVANYSASTAAKLGLPASEVSQIKTAALLHDIGLKGLIFSPARLTNCCGIFRVLPVNTR